MLRFGLEPYKLKQNRLSSYRRVVSQNVLLLNVNVPDSMRTSLDILDILWDTQDPLLSLLFQVIINVEILVDHIYHRLDSVALIYP
jgi:hypothetical protein